jgi:hypothetical protein
MTIVQRMSKPNEIKENFSLLLRDSLRSRYGRLPSAAVVAREFNLRASEALPISQESARRWLRGVSLPEEERLRILVNWLNLDFNKALQSKSKSSIDHFRTTRLNGNDTLNKNGENRGVGQPSASPNDSQAETLSHNGLDQAAHELIEAVLQMSAAEKLLLLDLVKLGFGRR